MIVAVGASSLFVVSTLADEWFDSYSKIDWNDETVHLKRLNRFLQDNANTDAYIIYQWTDAHDIRDMKSRAERARTYLIDKLGQNKYRIHIIRGIESEKCLTILQPVPKGAPPPSFQSRMF